MAPHAPTKRDLQVQARRTALVEAAEALIRDRRDVAFSMLELARAAGLSPTTPYNLFGTKAAILYALLNQSADRMFAVVHTPATCCSGRVIGAADALVSVLIKDPDFYRPLYAFLMGVPDANWRSNFMLRAHAYWMEPIEASRSFRIAVAPAVIGDLLVTQALGCVEMWVHHEVDDAALVVELRRSCAAVLLGLLPANEGEKLTKFLQAPRSIRVGEKRGV